MEYLLKDGKVVKDAKSWDLNQKCCITCRNLQLIIRMNRATVWSLQKKERDSCDIYFFSERGEGGAKSTSKVKCVLFYIKTAGMPKRINALKNVKQTIHFSKKQWWSRPIQTSPIQWPHLWNYCFWPDSQRVKYYHFQSSQASTPLPEILQFRFSKLSLRWIFNISMTIDTTPTSQRLVEQTKGQWNDIDQSK